MKNAAGCILLLILFAIPMFAGKHSDSLSTGPVIYIDPLNTGTYTNKGAEYLGMAMVEKRVPAQLTFVKNSAKYVLHYEGKDYKDCARTDVVSMPGIPNMGAIVCAEWNTGVTITKVTLVDVASQQAIWSYDLPKKTSWPAGDAAKHLKHFLEKENKH